ncbi:MAG: sulfocyanin-like copper-binding protein [Gaiellaceae bacterium]
MRRTAFILPFILLPLAAGCGGSGSSDNADTTASGSGGATVIKVMLGEPKEFALIPAPGTVPSGKVTFAVTNGGAVVHEMVVIKTDTAAGELGDANGEADETNAVGEVADLDPGKAKSITLDLAPGHYALLCNLPGHYTGGMFADFEVT